MTEDSHNTPSGASDPSGRAASLAREVESWTLDLLGGSLADIEGVLQTAAVWRRAGSGELVVLKICSETPKSDTDFLLLQLGRARAQAIVTTGKILRDEPDLDFALGLERDGLPSSAEHLESWRRELVGLQDPARVVLLSSGCDLPLHHPALEGREVTIVTSSDGQDRLAGPARAFGIEVVALPEPGLLTALEWLGSAGLGRVTVEAGPSTSKALYAETTRAAALCLSTLQSPSGEDIPTSIQGGSFLTGTELHERFEPVREAHSVEEAGGTWSFQLWRARVD